MNLKKRVLRVSLIVAVAAGLFFIIDTFNNITPFTITYVKWIEQFYNDHKPFTYAVWIASIILLFWMIYVFRDLCDDEFGFGCMAVVVVCGLTLGFIVFLPLIIPIVAVAALFYAPLSFIVEKLTIRSLKNDETYDLIYLYRKGFVYARGTGQSITKISGEIKNLLRKQIKIVIKPGTYFVAKGNYQNMATREEYTFTLMPNDRRSVSINATCINAYRPIPGEKDRFDGVKKVSSKLVRFLEASKGCSAMTVQAGVWAITDSFSGSKVIKHLVFQDRYGTPRQAVTEGNVAEARDILKELGIENNL